MLISRRPVQRKGNGEKCGFFATRSYLSVNVLVFECPVYLIRKNYLGTLPLRLLLETRPPFYVIIRSTPRSHRFAGKKQVPSSRSYFETLSIGPAPGIEPPTAVKHSTYRATVVLGRFKRSAVIAHSYSVITISSLRTRTILILISELMSGSTTPPNFPRQATCLSRNNNNSNKLFFI